MDRKDAEVGLDYISSALLYVELIVFPIKKFERDNPGVSAPSLFICGESGLQMSTLKTNACGIWMTIREALLFEKPDLIIAFVADNDVVPLGSDKLTPEEDLLAWAQDVKVTLSGENPGSMVIVAPVFPRTQGKYLKDPKVVALYNKGAASFNTALSKIQSPRHRKKDKVHQYLEDSMEEERLLFVPTPKHHRHMDTSWLHKDGVHASLSFHDDSAHRTGCLKKAD